MATDLLEKLDEHQPGYVSVAVLVELHWVLRRAHQVPASRAAEVVQRLLDAKEIRVAEADVVRRALARAAEGIDFVDALIGELGAAAGCEATVTFDRRASHLPHMRLLQ